MATYSRVNKYGFIETPYRKVVREIDSDYDSLIGRRIRENVLDDDNKAYIKAGSVVTAKHIEKLRNCLPAR